jgi:hypothetical protein
MKKKTEHPKQSDLTTPQLAISELEGSFYGNGIDNNENLINALKANPFAKSLLESYAHNEKGFVFDIAKSAQLAFLSEIVENKNDNGVSYQKIINPKIAFLDVATFNTYSKRGLLGTAKITVLHNPEKEFVTTEGEKLKVVNNKFIQTL